jgi:NTE family protein
VITEPGGDSAMGAAPPARDAGERTTAGENRGSDFALVLSGGGARGAYQTGVLRCLARHLPDLSFPIITGISAGAINAAQLASHPGSLAEATCELCDIWGNLEVEDIFRVDLPSLARLFSRWAARLVSGGASMAPDVRGLVDTRPLHELIKRTAATVDGELIGVERNLELGRLKAFALTGLNYTTGQTVTWVQGRDVHPWHLPRHRSVSARITVDHVMASASLPMFFPAVRVGDAWYGDGSIRLSAPLSPALRLGATRILVISPAYQPSQEESEHRKSEGYPPPAQILSYLVGGSFHDALDEDIRRLTGTNELLKKLPPEQHGRLRHVEIRVLRPSQSLGKIANAFEPDLPSAFRYLTRGLGTKESETSGFLSMVMFQGDFCRRLIELGEADTEARIEKIRELVEGPTQTTAV